MSLSTLPSLVADFESCTVHDGCVVVVWPGGAHTHCQPDQLRTLPDGSVEITVPWISLPEERTPKAAPA